jgi:hypothetical protein
MPADLRGARPAFPHHEGRVGLSSLQAGAEPAALARESRPSTKSNSCGSTPLYAYHRGSAFSIDSTPRKIYPLFDCRFSRDCLLKLPRPRGLKSRGFLVEVRVIALREGVRPVGGACQDTGGPMIRGGSHRRGPWPIVPLRSPWTIEGSNRHSGPSSAWSSEMGSSGSSGGGRATRNRGNGSGGRSARRRAGAVANCPAHSGE